MKKHNLRKKRKNIMYEMSKHQDGEVDGPRHPGAMKAHSPQMCEVHTPRRCIV
jgi:hypothetical protein